MNKVNVVCVKWGTLYSSDYVNKLYSMVKRNLTMEFDFYCITDNPSNIRKEVISIPCPIDWLHDVGSTENQWYKESMFFPGTIPERKTLYLDLDVVIVSSLDPLFQYDDRFWCISKDFLKRNMPTFHGAVMVFNPKYWYDFFQYFQNKVKSGYKLIRGNEQPLIAEYHMVKKYKNLITMPNEWIWSFKYGHLRDDITVYNSHIYRGYTPPKGGIICSFHGFPSQHQIIELEYIDKNSIKWIMENWKND